MRAVRVVTENAAVDREFDYAVPEHLAVEIGDRVRVDFHQRSLRAWVVGEVDATREMKFITKSLGRGPSESGVELARWVADRWSSPLSLVLRSLSPDTIISTLVDPPPKIALDDSIARVTPKRAPGIYELSPCDDPLALVLSAYEQTYSHPGSLLVLVPTESYAQRMATRLTQRGLAVAHSEQAWLRARSGWPVIVGTRGAALSPAARLSGAVVLDGEDESFRSSAAPTWSALAIVAQRCANDGVPLWVTTVVASPEVLVLGERHPSSDSSGWPTVVVDDRREADPRDGALTQGTITAAHEALAGSSDVAVAVVLQRLGAGRLWACTRCRELARCDQCGQAELLVGSLMTCADQHERREPFCRACGATTLRRVRSGVTTLAADVAAQLSQPVSEVTATSTNEPMHRVVVGTEAVFRQVRRCSLVIFADFDQYLLAPRSSARRQALSAVARAGRLVGPRRDSRGLVIVQTRRDDDVTASLVAGRVDEIIDGDVATAILLGEYPYRARAEISGPGATQFMASFSLAAARVTRVGEIFVVRHDESLTLARALKATPRPAERVRIAVS